MRVCKGGAALACLAETEKARLWAAPKTDRVANIVEVENVAGVKEDWMWECEKANMDRRTEGNVTMGWRRFALRSRLPPVSEVFQWCKCVFSIVRLLWQPSHIQYL